MLHIAIRLLSNCSKNQKNLVFETCHRPFMTLPPDPVDGHSISAPPCPYKLQPEYQGKLVWIAGTPGSGKSTLAQLMAREKGYVYYEGDCFHGMRNPYIPPDADNPSVAQIFQKFLIGNDDEVEERKNICSNASVLLKVFKGGHIFTHKDQDLLRMYYAHLCQDILRERKRIGGDWVVAYVAFNKQLRQLVRSALGPELKMIYLNMSETRLREHLIERTRGNMTATNAFMNFLSVNNPPDIDEEDGVIVIDVEEGMSREDVLNLIMATVEK